MANLDQIQQTIGYLRDAYQNDPKNIDLYGVFVMLDDPQESNVLLILNFLINDISTEEYPLFKTIVEKKLTVKLFNKVSERLKKSLDDRFQIACFDLLNHLSEKLPGYDMTFRKEFDTIINTFLGKHNENPIILNNANFSSIIESIKLVTRYEIKKYYSKSLHILLQVPLVQEDQSQSLIDQSSIIFKKTYSAYFYLLEDLPYKCPFDFIDKLRQMPLLHNFHDELEKISDEILCSQYGFAGSIQEYDQIETYQHLDIRTALLSTLKDICNKYEDYDPNYTEYKDCDVRFDRSAKIVYNYFIPILKYNNIENDNIRRRKDIFFAVNFFFLESKSFLSDVVKDFRDLIEQFEDFTKLHDLDTCFDEDYVYKFLVYTAYEN